MGKLIHRLEKFVYFINSIAAKIAAILVFAMMMLTFLDVSGRFIWRPITGTHELTYLGLALIIFLTLGFTQQKKGHISVGFLIDKLNEKAQAIVDFITYIIMLIILSLMSWRMFVYAEQMSTGVTGDLNLPIGIFVIICAIGSLLFALTVIIDLLKAIQKVVSKNES